MENMIETHFSNELKKLIIIKDIQRKISLLIRCSQLSDIHLVFNFISDEVLS